jgi:hypothetical protein
MDKIIMEAQVSSNKGNTNSDISLNRRTRSQDISELSSTKQSTATTAEQLSSQPTTAEKILAIQTTLDNLKGAGTSSQPLPNQDEEVNIPSAPLYHLGMAALGSKNNLIEIQNTVDHLDKKAHAKEPFTEDEKEFMKELYEAFAWGGIAKGMPEAAALADHYVSGNGEPLEMDPEPYKSSVVVNDTMDAMKSHIRELAENKQSFHSLKTNDANFKNSQHLRPLMMINGSRDKDTEGYVRSDGLIYAEQNNHRLQKADNRFYLQADTIQLSNGDFQTTWRVDNTYDFEPYSKGDKVTTLPLDKNLKLNLPDGLSEYMDSGLGIAVPFKYHAKWTEVWR